MNKKSALTAYGEITSKGIDTLMNEFKEHFDNPNAVFYDLGSGKGDMVIYIAENTNIKKCCGIELHKQRFNIAQEKLNKLSLDNVIFLNQDILKSDISDATIIYTDNLAMPRKWMDQLWDNIPKNTLVVSSKHVNKKGKGTKLKVILERTYTDKYYHTFEIKE